MQTLNAEIKKLKIKETVLFAINNIPEADATTLKQFLELLNAGGTFGSASHAQIIKIMHQVLRYIPNARLNSFLILTDLLEIELPSQQLLGSPQSRLVSTNQENQNSNAFFIDMTPAGSSRLESRHSAY